MFTSILCPVDFSVHSERALGYALDLAAMTHGHLTIVTVVDPLLDAAAHEASTAQNQQEIKSLLERLVTTRAKPYDRVGISVEVGDPARKILEQIDECHADLVVMGTQGLEGPRRLFFGSTTERVVRESRVPVLAVPADAT